MAVKAALIFTAKSLSCHPTYSRVISPLGSAVLHKFNFTELIVFIKTTWRVRCRLGVAALGGLVLAGGCRQPNFAPPSNGIGGALSPGAVRQYAQQRGISDAQARQELRQKVSQHDEEQALKNIDEMGAIKR